MEYLLFRYLVGGPELARGWARLGRHDDLPLMSVDDLRLLCCVSNGGGQSMGGVNRRGRRFGSWRAG